jgi:hypothetical protein
VYWKAAQIASHGGDPYAQGISAQRKYYGLADNEKPKHAPMTYVYPPMTLKILRMAARLPRSGARSTFWVTLAFGFSLQVFAGWQMAGHRERQWLAWLLPAVIFFPGLLNDDVLMSGNIAYLLYGLILGAAVAGWKQNRWRWFYAAVLFAASFKAPMLSLLAFPVVVGHTQWRPAAATAAAGIGLFAAQARLWPVLFHEYLIAVQSQFDINSDFGASPSGILGNLLGQSGHSYRLAAGMFYLVFAGSVLSLLLLAKWKIGSDRRLCDQWIPIAMVGTLLLNPRIKEYDVAALTIPMVLIGARLLTAAFAVENIESARDLRRASTTRLRNFAPIAPPLPLRERIKLPLLAGGWFLAANAGKSGDTAKPIELALLLLSFSAGTWWTIRQASAAQLPSLMIAAQPNGSFRPRYQVS